VDVVEVSIVALMRLFNTVLDIVAAAVVIGIEVEVVSIRVGATAMDTMEVGDGIGVDEDNKVEVAMSFTVSSEAVDETS